MGVTPRLRSTYLLVAATGAAAALVTAVGGVVLERRRFGADDRETVARIERELVQQFNRSGAALAAVASDLSDERDLIRGAAADQAAARALFDALERAAPAGTSATGITVYNTAGEPLAWTGRVSDLPPERTQGPAALFVAPDALGLRLVRVQPVADASRSSTTTRLGSLVVEQLLGADRVTPGAADTFMMRSSIAPVSVRAAIGGAQRRSDYAFVIPSSDGQVLVEAETAPADVADARARWRSQTVGWVLAVLALTMLVCTGPLLDTRRRARARAPLLAATAGLIGVLLTARYLLRLATVRLVEGDAQGPIDLLLWALLLVALVWLALDLIERRRVASPRPPLQRAQVVQLMLAYAAAGAFASSLVWAYDRFLQNIVSRTTLDLLHFSLHPLSASRVAIGFGLILLHAGVFWSAALVPRIIAVAWRQRRSAARRAGLAGAWIAGALAAAGAATRIAGPVPMIPLFLALAAIGACALALGRPRGRMRRASQTATIVGIFAALVVPSLAMYPSLHAFTTEAKDRLVAEQYGPAALRLRDDLQTSLNRAGEEIDALPSLNEFLIEPADETESTDAAYQLWSKTDLADARVTSAVELYRADGRLVSRFFLNLPEYAITSFRAANCRWDVIDEYSPIGSSERHVLRASRGICQNGRQLGTVAVRVMLDYRVLPFISGRTPYLESFRIPTEGTAEGAAGRDLEFVWYGWSRSPLYVSGHQRVAAARSCVRARRAVARAVLGRGGA